MPNAARHALAVWHQAFEDWCTHQRQSGRLRRGASEAVYRAMWQSLAAWCVSQAPAVLLRSLDAAALQAYVASRHGSAGPDEALTPRYHWRLLRLVQRVQEHRSTGARPSTPTCAKASGGKPACSQRSAKARIEGELVSGR